MRRLLLGREVGRGWMPKGNRRPRPWILGVGLLGLVLVGIDPLFFGIETPPISSGRPVPVRKVPAAKPPEPSPAPARPAEPELGLEVQMLLAIPAGDPSRAAVEALEHTPSSFLNWPSLDEETSRFARFIQRRGKVKFFLFSEDLAEDGNVLALGKLNAGYGRLFKDESPLVRGFNGTAWEEPSAVYLKATFRF